MFKNKGTCDFGMAGDAVCLIGLDTLAVITIGVRVVAIATDHTPFGNWMMEILAKFGDLSLMALSTEGRLIRLEKGFWLWCSREERSKRIATGGFTSRFSVLWRWLFCAFTS